MPPADEERQAQGREVKLDGAVDYHHGRIPPARLDYARLIAPLGRAATAIGRYDAMLGTLHNKELLLAPLRQQEAIVSSRIEGTIATLDELLTLEASEDDGSPGTQDKQAPRHEVIEVRAYTRALHHAQRAMAEENLPICGRLIREAHRHMLFSGRGGDKRPGEFRTGQNYISDGQSRKIRFVPIEEPRLEAGFKAFEDYINDETVEPLIQTAVSHAEFEALHPFDDGNGRIGRMIVTLNLWNKGLIGGPHFYVSSRIEARRDEYIDRLRAVSADDAWTEWCIFFLDVLAAQAKENLEIASRIAALYEEMKKTFATTLKSHWATLALDTIFAKPVFWNAAFTANSSIPKQTAARFTKRLAEAGLLETPIPASGSRSALHAFEPLLRLVRG